MVSSLSEVFLVAFIDMDSTKYTCVLRTKAAMKLLISHGTYCQKTPRIHYTLNLELFFCHAFRNTSLLPSSLHVQLPSHIYLNDKGVRDGNLSGWGLKAKSKPFLEEEEPSSQVEQQVQRS